MLTEYKKSRLARARLSFIQEDKDDSTGKKKKYHKFQTLTNLSKIFLSPKSKPKQQHKDI